MDAKLMKLKITWLESRKTVAGKQLPADVKDLLIECLTNETVPAPPNFFLQRLF